MSMNEEEVKKVINAELMKIKKGANFKGKWELNFKVSKEYAPGMPWEEQKEELVLKLSEDGIYHPSVRQGRIQDGWAFKGG